MAYGNQQMPQMARTFRWCPSRVVSKFDYSPTAVHTDGMVPMEWQVNTVALTNDDLTKLLEKAFRMAAQGVNAKYNLPLKTAEHALLTLCTGKNDPEEAKVLTLSTAYGVNVVAYGMELFRSYLDPSYAPDVGRMHCIDPALAVEQSDEGPEAKEVPHE